MSTTCDEDLTDNVRGAREADAWLRDRMGDLDCGYCHGKIRAHALKHEKANPPGTTCIYNWFGAAVQNLRGGH